MIIKPTWVFAFVVLSTGLMGGRALTPSSFLSTVDKDRLRKVFADSIGKEGINDLPSVSYAVLGYKLLGDTSVLEGAKADIICKKLQDGAKSAEASVANAYQAASAAKELKGCKLTLGPTASKAVTNALVDGSPTHLYHAYMAQISLGATLPDKANIAKLLTAALKNHDSSLADSGYAFNLAAMALDAKEAKGIFDLIEDAVVQADEVDGKMLQFEGGLSVTHMIVNGAYKLAEKVGKTPPITKMQAVKFANYFLSRKSVQQSKGGYHLLQSLNTLSNNKYHIPVSVALASQSTVSESVPMVRIRVSDLLGRALGKMDVTVESAMRSSDGLTIMSNTKMLESKSDHTVYEVDMMKAKPARGFYDLTINAVPTKSDERLVGNSGAMLKVKALSSISIDDVELGIGDADQSTAPKVNKLVHPQKFSTLLQADHHHKVILKFGIQDKTSKDRIKVHQAFVRMYCSALNQEIVYVAEPSDANNNQYKFDLDVSANAKEFGGKSGKYEMHLIIGDAVISNPQAWHLADVELSFPGDVAVDVKPNVDGLQTHIVEGMKPEIKHTFRQPEQRPPAIISNAFTVLCLTPFLIMIGLWIKLGVNVSAFPFTLPALGFHVGLAAIFGLYYMFWLEFNMFTTVKYLIMIGVVTFLCGNSMLSGLAEKRKAAQ